MKIFAIILPWSILLIIAAVGITTWQWAIYNAQQTAVWEGTYAAQNKAREIVETDRQNIRYDLATANAELAHSTTLTYDWATASGQYQATIQAHASATPYPTYTIPPTQTAYPTYTPKPTATRRPTHTPRPTYTRYPTPTRYVRFQTPTPSYRPTPTSIWNITIPTRTVTSAQIRCTAAPDFHQAAGSPGVGDTVHIYTGVKVETSAGQGRGYIEYHNGHKWVVTAAHVVAGSRTVQVEGKSYSVHSRHPDKDVAFIYIGPAPNSTGGFDADCLGRHSFSPIIRAYEHSSEYSWGSSPDGDECYIRNTYFYRLSADTTYQGNSGSPVVNTSADRLIGILICGDDEETIVIPAGEYSDLIPDRP